MKTEDNQYKQKLGFKANDLLLVRRFDSCGGNLVLVYKVLGFKKVEYEPWRYDDKELADKELAVCIRRCSPKIENYSDYAELICREFISDKWGLKIQGHRITKITEQEAIMEML
jgi:hypothetical protein